MNIATRFVASTLLIAVLFVACQSGGRVFQATLRADSIEPLPITLTDETNLVTGITAAPTDTATIPNDPAVGLDRDDPNRLVLTWLGGACDQDAAVWFGQQNGGYVLSVEIHGRFGLGGCTAVGVPRAIRIGVSRAIPVESIVVAGGSS